MLKVKYQKRAEKFYATLPYKQQRQVSHKVELLRENPFPNDSKKLKGFPCYSASSGEFRIIYEVDNEILEIVSIAKRNDDDSYKFLHRFFIL